MKSRIFMGLLICLQLLSPSLFAKEVQKPSKLPVSVVFKSGQTIDFKNLMIGYADSSLFGSSSFKSLDSLPLKTPDLSFEIPLKNLVKIEFISSKKLVDGTDVSVKLTDRKGKILEGSVVSEKSLQWRSIYDFADSEVILDPDKMKEINIKH
ncbi:MAG: hypothetical protein HQK54_14715 [Oligoflexales bacterium]|nr:hypothetical protein [Oligoflexales bacterium]